MLALILLALFAEVFLPGTEGMMETFPCVGNPVPSM